MGMFVGPKRVDCGGFDFDCGAIDGCDDDDDGRAEAWDKEERAVKDEVGRLVTG